MNYYIDMFLGISLEVSIFFLVPYVVSRFFPRYITLPFVTFYAIEIISLLFWTQKQSVVSSFTSILNIGIIEKLGTDIGYALLHLCIIIIPYCMWRIFISLYLKFLDITINSKNLSIGIIVIALIIFLLNPQGFNPGQEFARFVLYFFMSVWGPVVILATILAPLKNFTYYSLLLVIFERTLLSLYLFYKSNTYAVHPCNYINLKTSNILTLFMRVYYSVFTLAFITIAIYQDTTYLPLLMYISIGMTYIALLLYTFLRLQVSLKKEEARK